MIVLSFLLIVLVAVVAGAVASFSVLPLIPAIAAVLVGVPLFTWLAVIERRPHMARPAIPQRLAPPPPQATGIVERDGSCLMMFIQEDGERGDGRVVSVWTP